MKGLGLTKVFIYLSRKQKERNMGPRVSKSSSEVNNTIRNTMNNSLQGAVSAGTNLRCNNIQSIIGSEITNCEINFSSQSCTASVVSEVVINQEFQNDVVQDIYSEIKSLAESLNKDISLQLADISVSSSYVKSLVETAQQSSIALSSSCTQNISNVNIQSIEDSVCYDSTVNFDSQEISTENISSCVANQYGSNLASQRVQSVIDSSATATIDGVSLIDALVPFLVFILLIFVCVIAFKFVFGAVQGAENGQGSGAPGLFVGLMFLCILLFLWALFVWPGVTQICVAAQIGVWPWPTPVVNGEGGAYCPDGSEYPLDEIINLFVWWDEKGVAGPAGERKYNGENCGLMGTNECDNTEFQSELTSFRTVNEACRRSLPGGILEDNYAGQCTILQMANAFFADGASLYGSNGVVLE
jgi:hypothetical protein